MCRYMFVSEQKMNRGLLTIIRILSLGFRQLNANVVTGQLPFNAGIKLQRSREKAKYVLMTWTKTLSEHIRCKCTLTSTVFSLIHIGINAETKLPPHAG